MSRSRKRTIALKLITLAVSTFVSLGVLVGADLYLHHKHGINVRGYRGPTLGPKGANEKRVAILGGSTTWGYGLNTEQSFPAQLHQLLTQTASQNDAAITVINLGANGDGAYGAKFTLQDYDYLDCDAVIFYTGYNDLGDAPNQLVQRHRSLLFVSTGYLQLLPMLTIDKLTVWKSQLLGQNDRAIFQPPNSQTIQSSQTLEQQLGKLTAPDGSSPQPSATCPPRWEFYCQQISESIDLALKKNKRVLILTEPYISDQHVAQQLALKAMIANRFAGNPNISYVNLGTVVDLRDKSLCWDGMHLTEEGNRRIAAAMVTPIRELLRR
jgi:lysophospholipase L1-like esterase